MEPLAVRSTNRPSYTPPPGDSALLSIVVGDKYNKNYDNNPWAIVLLVNEFHAVSPETASIVVG